MHRHLFVFIVWSSERAIEENPAWHFPIIRFQTEISQGQTDIIYKPVLGESGNWQTKVENALLVEL